MKPCLTPHEVAHADLKDGSSITVCLRCRNVIASTTAVPSLTGEEIEALVDYLIAFRDWRNGKKPR